MKKALKDFEDIALSDSDLRRISNGKANIVLYQNLIKFRSIDQVLGPYGACFLLFTAKPHYGHWCLLFKRKKNLIEFFNPYGGFPDDSLDYIPMDYRLKSNQLHTNLSFLLDKSPYELEYNEFPFQARKKDIKTCGRWCGFRLICRNLDIYQFKELIDDFSDQLNLTPDQVVTLVTINYGKKQDFK